MIHQYEQYNCVLVYNVIFQQKILSVLALTQIDEHQLKLLLVKGRIY